MTSVMIAWIPWKQLGLGLVSATLIVLNPPAVAASPDSAEWRFRVFLDGKEIGYHAFRLSTVEGKQLVESEASFEVRFLVFNAYSYEHQSHELWAGDCLHSIESTTNDNGDRQWVAGRQIGEGFQVDSSSGRKTVAACPMTFAYWNPAILRASRLLNAQTGEYLEVDTKPSGQRSFKVGGSALDAKEWTLVTRDREIRLWYDPGERWLSLESTTEGGRTLRYELVEMPSVVFLARYLDQPE